jgi:hypothetical protein
MTKTIIISKTNTFDKSCTIERVIFNATAAQDISSIPVITNSIYYNNREADVATLNICDSICGMGDFLRGGCLFWN